MTRGYIESAYNISSIPEGKLIYIFKMVLKSSFKNLNDLSYLSGNSSFHTSNKTKCQDLWNLCTKIK